MDGLEWNGMEWDGMGFLMKERKGRSEDRDGDRMGMGIRVGICKFLL